ncbi:hypothetical protein H8959_016137 [Pygathrix nigripes]
MTFFNIVYVYLPLPFFVSLKRLERKQLKQFSEGNFGGPLEGFRIQILRCSCLTAENHDPPGVLRPHPWLAQAGYARATPPVSLPVWPMEELRMARPARAWQSPVVLCMEAWEDFVGRGGRERVLEALGRWLPHPFQPSSLPGFGGPQLSQLAWKCDGLPLPCGSLRHSSAW